MAAARFLRRAPRHLVAGLIRLYQLLLSPLLGLLTAPGYGQTCRFYPSCSEYGLVAVQQHGVLRGGRLAIWRILRCNPWNPGGVDHVPGVPGPELLDDVLDDVQVGPLAGSGADPDHTHLSDQISAADPSAAVDGRTEPAEQSAARCDRHAA